MTTVQQLLDPLLANTPLLAYVVLFGATIILGNIASFTALFIGVQNYSHSPVLLFIIFTILVADVVADCTWYSMGRALQETRLGKWIRRRIPKREHIEKHLRVNSRRWIFLSKYIYSSTFAIIFSVGWARVPFKKFFPVSLFAIGTSVPLLLLISFGLSKGLTALEAIEIFKHFERILFVGIVVFLILMFVVRKVGHWILDRE